MPRAVRRQPTLRMVRTPNWSTQIPLMIIIGISARLRAERSPPTRASPMSRRRASANLMLPRRVSTIPKVKELEMATAAIAAPLPMFHLEGVAVPRRHSMRQFGQEPPCLRCDEERGWNYLRESFVHRYL